MSEGPGAKPKRSMHKLIATAGIVLLLLATFTHAWSFFRNTNEAIRIDFVQAVVEHGEATIDPVLERYFPNFKAHPRYLKGWHPSIDAAHYQGANYMDKAPGLSFLAIPAYGALRVFGIDDRPQNWTTWLFLLRLLAVTFPVLLGLWWLRSAVVHLTQDPALGTRIAVITAVATPVGLYATLRDAYRYG